MSAKLFFLARHRKDDVENRGFPWIALDFHFSTVIFYNSFADRQSQPQSFAFLCGKERQKYLWQIILFDTEAGINYGDRHCRSADFIVSLFDLHT